MKSVCTAVCNILSVAVSLCCKLVTVVSSDFVCF